MRKLMWFVIGFGTACAGCVYLKLPQQMLLPSVLLVIVLLLLSGNRQILKTAAIFLLGFCGGVFWFSRFQMLTLNPLYALDGITQDVTLRCSSYSEPTDNGVRAEGSIQVGDRSYKVLMYLNEEQPEPGTLYSGPFQLLVTAPGGQKASSNYQGEGVFLLAYQKGDLTCRQDSVTWKDRSAVLRQKLLGILHEALPEDTAAFAKALLLGDTNGLDYATLTHLTVSGFRHVVAVSGLHVSVLFGLLTILTFRRRFLSALIVFPLLTVFAAITGFTPSVSRACLMCALLLVSMLVDQEYDGPTALAFSGLVLLLLNPYFIVSVGFQLSFASVAGIFLFTPGIQKWLRSCFRIKKEERFQRRFAAWFSVSVSVTLGATVATLPLCAIYYGVISLAAPLTNLLVLWAVGFIFCGLMGVCLFGFFWHTGAAFMGSLVSVLIRFVLLTAKEVAGFPLSAVYASSGYITVWLVFIYLLLAVFLLSKNRKPIIFGCCTVLSLCIALLASRLAPMADDMRFTVLDVGQGQCLLLQTGGRSFLVDCGGSTDGMAADAAAETLLSQGVFYLDGIILTHYDRDHAGGLENLLSRIPSKLLILPPVYSELQLKADQILYAEEDLLIASDKMKIHIFAPDMFGSSNENSLCILFDTNNCDILVTGDRNGFAERLLLRRTTLPDVDVLVAGHHGSSDATCDELLAAVRPEIVCISAGANNRFGHPSPDLLQRLDAYGCRVYRTDLHGDIIIRR